VPEQGQSLIYESGSWQVGVWLVELASLSDAGLVAVAAAGVLGLHLAGNDISPEALARAIGGRKLLLVIDNCEHLIDAAARVVETVVRLCPATSVLTTSREPMRIEGECTYRVPPLDLPPVRSTSGREISAGQTDAAYALLRPVFKQFEEGFDTAVLKSAARLLTHWTNRR
jgi:predicted ATPase